MELEMNFVIALHLKEKLNNEIQLPNYIEREMCVNHQLTI